MIGEHLGKVSIKVKSFTILFNMILTEQLYKNLNRRYFHGSKTGKLEKADSFYDYFYIKMARKMPHLQCGI